MYAGSSDYPLNTMHDTATRKPLILEMLAYFLKPYHSGQYEYSTWKKIKDSIRLWAFGTTVAIFLGAVAVNSLGRLGYDAAEYNSLNRLFEENWLSLLMIAAIIGPLSEELLFRFWLRFSPYRLGFSLSAAVVLGIGAFMQFASEHTRAAELALNAIPQALLAAGMACLFVSAGIFFGYLFGQPAKQRLLANFFERKYHWFFYGSAGAFSFLHIFNFYSFGDYWYAVLMLIMPQLFLGFLLGFVRMRFGFVWSVFLHSAYNSAISLPAILYGLLSDDAIAAIDSGGTSWADALGPRDDLVVSLIGIYAVLFMVVILWSNISLLAELPSYVKARKHRQSNEP